MTSSFPVNSGQALLIDGYRGDLQVCRPFRAPPMLSELLDLDLEKDFLAP